MEVDDRNLTTEELADRERVPLATVHQWNHRGVGPRRMRVGKRILYRLSDVIAWEDSRAIEPDGAA